MSNHLGANAGRYAAQFALWIVLFSVAVKSIGYRLSEFVPAFVFVYVLSLRVFVLGQWIGSAFRSSCSASSWHRCS